MKNLKYKNVYQVVYASPIWMPEWYLECFLRDDYSFGAPAFVEQICYMLYFVCSGTYILITECLSKERWFGLYTNEIKIWIISLDHIFFWCCNCTSVFLEYGNQYHTIFAHISFLMRFWSFFNSIEDKYFETYAKKIHYKCLFRYIP